MVANLLWQNHNLANPPGTTLHFRFLFSIYGRGRSNFKWLMSCVWLGVAEVFASLSLSQHIDQ